MGIGMVKVMMGAHLFLSHHLRFSNSVTSPALMMIFFVMHGLLLLRHSHEQRSPCAETSCSCTHIPLSINKPRYSCR